MRFCVHCKKPIRWFRTVVNGCCGKWIPYPLPPLPQDEYLNEMFKDEYPIRFGKVMKALNEYLNVFMSCPDMQFEEESKLSRIAWSENDDRETSRLIVRLALLLSHLRAVVTTWDTAGHGGTDYAYAIAQIEDPSRAITQLRNLARGHALSSGRTQITMENIPPGMGRIMDRVHLSLLTRK